MSKGSPKPTDQTVVQTNLPEYVQPYFERLLNRTEAETKQQYQPYQGQRLQTGGTDVTDAQQMGRNIAGQGIQGLPQAQAATMAGLGRSLQGMGYQAGQFDNAAAQQYMSPYMQQVVDVQKQQAIRKSEKRYINMTVKNLKLIDHILLIILKMQKLIFEVALKNSSSIIML